MRAIESTFLLFLLLLAAASLFFTLSLPSIGEEGVYTNITLEMLHNKNYLSPTLYGAHYYRPPLFNWLILGFIKLIGPAHVVVAARLVTIISTLATCGLLVWFTVKKFADKRLALFTAAIYLSGDLLFKRGWLAYADPLFSFFVFSAIICLWMALDTKHNRWFVGASLSLCLGFLAKIQAIYVFYALAVLVLVWKHPNRKFIFCKFSWVMHMLAILFGLLWLKDLNANLSYSQSLAKSPNILKYVIHFVATYPIDLIIRFLPASIIAFAIWYKTRQKNDILFWIILLNLLPYWFVPLNSIRYIMPLYPLIALFMADIIWRAGNNMQIITVRCLIAGLALQFISVVWLLPYEYKVHRGNAQEVALDIMRRTKDHNLYINDTTSQGLRVAVELNKLRANRAPLTFPPTTFSGYLIAENASPDLGELQQVYSLRNKKIYLLLKASAG